MLKGHFMFHHLPIKPFAGAKRIHCLRQKSTILAGSGHITSTSDKKDNNSEGETVKEMAQKSDNPRFQKQVHDLIVTPEKHKKTARKVKSPPHKIQKYLNTNITCQQECNGVPEGFSWSDNSCAYNAVLT